MAIGVFGLQVAYKLKRIELMSLNDTHGWTSGGTPLPAVSTVDRIDFSNDTGTTNIRGPLSSSRYRHAATGNSNYGWFGGGFGPVSRVDRIDFSNDFTTASPRSPLSSARDFLTATGNSNYGWFGGGFNVGVLSTVDRIDFSNDSATASPRGPLSSARQTIGATGNSNYGWFGAGNTPGGYITFIERIDFSNDFATASVRGLLNFRDLQSATGNSNYAWFSGGITPSPVVTASSSVERIDFSNDLATASPRGSLIQARRGPTATGNSNYGWFGGGYTPSSPPTSTVDRIDFSNDSATASVRGVLSSVRLQFASTSGQAKGPAIKLAKTAGYGWFGGGASTSRVDRIDFSNDSSTASIRGPLGSSAVAGAGAAGNSNYGWFGGGNNPTNPTIVLSTVNRIDFSNDLNTAQLRGLLSQPKQDVKAVGNYNYGWFGAARTPNLSLRVDRIDFSSDLTTSSIRSPLSGIRYDYGATGNSNYGWFGGGLQFPSLYITKVDRIDFSNDSATALPRGFLAVGRSKLAATGNSNYGWFGGGSSPAFPTLFASTVDRIDFSNDSATASLRGQLSLERDTLAATGNSNYGWFGGGSPSISRVDRIDFSNDSATASVRGALSSTRSSHAATSNTTR